MEHHALGERFGDYTLVRPLGEGGFASVYLGQEVHTGTSAAVKLLKEQQVHDFINELRRTVLLQHPHIVKILDFGIRTPDNAAFIIMEYAPNGSFCEKYPRGTRVPLDIVITVVKQVASALQYAHDQRVIHRDVKPENLLLNARNLVLLSDFGIATASHTAMTPNTGQSDIIGTYAYMAPEQLKGRPVPASDQYSLAIMAYEWLCGKLPFEGREYIQWAYQHQEVPPPPLRDGVPSLSPAVEQVVLRALAKKPEERFERVETFASALARAARGEDVSSPVPVWTPSNAIEHLFQQGVRAQASGNAEEAFRIWRQMMTIPDVAEQYSYTARNRIRALRPQMIPLRLKQARKASIQGRWQDEIRLWEDLLALEPSPQDLAPLLTSPLTLGTYFPGNTTIQERLQIARQNAQSAWIYTGVQQCIQNKDYASARDQLQVLWQDAPYYGDPAGLAQTMGLPAAMNYEQAIATEQVRLKQAAAAEQMRLKQERLERERLERERQEQERLEGLKQEQALAKLGRNNILLLILIGAGVIVGAAIGRVVEVSSGVGLGVVGILARVGLPAGIAGILAGIAEGVEIVEEDVSKLGMWIVAVATGLIGAWIAAVETGIVANVGWSIAGVVVILFYGIGGGVVIGIGAVIVYRIVWAVVGAVVWVIKVLLEKIRGIS